MNADATSTWLGTLMGSANSPNASENTKRICRGVGIVRLGYRLLIWAFFLSLASGAVANAFGLYALENSLSQSVGYVWLVVASFSLVGMTICMTGSTGAKQRFTIGAATLLIALGLSISLLRWAGYLETVRFDGLLGMISVTWFIVFVNQVAASIGAAEVEYKAIRVLNAAVGLAATILLGPILLWLSVSVGSVVCLGLILVFVISTFCRLFDFLTSAHAVLKEQA